MTIRRIYAHVSALAAEQGYPRASHETPYEYLPALEQAFPESHEEVAHITGAYVAVHYGSARAPRGFGGDPDRVGARP